MSEQVRNRLPYVLGILLAGFLLLFSFDVFEPGTPFLEGLFAFGMHSLPTVALLIALAAARHSERAGGALCVLLALASAVLFNDPVGRIITVVPLLIIGGLFIWNGERHTRTESVSGVG